MLYDNLNLGEVNANPKSGYSPVSAAELNLNEKCIRVHKEFGGPGLRMNSNIGKEFIRNPIR